MKAIPFQVLPMELYWSMFFYKAKIPKDYTIIYFFLIFSVAFVAGERKSLVQQGLLRDLPGNGVGNGIATSHATGAAFSERKLHLTEFFIGQLTKTVSKIPVRC